MKVVLFCGGLGLRLREYNESVPKPMVPIGYRPILWHLMKYYAHYGHTDFILCLGWQANVIKDFFLNYNECTSNNFVLRDSNKVELLNSDIHDWTITFVDTGTNAHIGQRLKAVKPFLEGEDVFLANYSDGLTDLPLPRLIDHFYEEDTIATCMGVKPNQSFHLINADSDGFVKGFTPIAHSDIWMNAGFFVFRPEVFDYIHDGEDLVAEPFDRITAEQKLRVYRHDGFFACMDTYKEKQILNDAYQRGEAPWTVWEADTASRKNRSAESSRLRSAVTATTTSPRRTPVARTRPR